jgi:hypothetical protein
MAATALPSASVSPPAATPELTRLRAGIGWICHAIRLAALVWTGWVLLRILILWGDRSALVGRMGRAFGVDPASISSARYWGSFALLLAAWAVAALLCWRIWQLFGSYLQGRIFTVDAALRMRALALAGFAATLADMAVRPLQFLVLLGHLPERIGFGYPVPHDLLHLLISGFVFALATIFKTAAEIAEDHAQIV